MVSELSLPRPALIIIDIQKQFADGGRLGVAGADRVFGPLDQLVRAARCGGAPVVWTAYRLPTSRVLGRTSSRLGIDGLHVGEQAELLITPEAGDIVLDKPRQSAFYGTPLESYLRALGVDTVVICGWTANSCVLATSFDAAARDLDVVVVPDATWAMPIPENEKSPGISAEEVVAASMAFVRWSLGKTFSTEAAVALLKG